MPELAVPKCSHCGELTFDYEADDQIRRAFEAIVLENNRLNAAVRPVVGKLDVSASDEA